MTPRRTICHFVIGTVGLIIAILGAVLGWVVFPIVVDDQVAETVALKNGTDAYDRWKELPLALQFKVYVFDILNPENITEFGDLPIVREVGPYVYTETRVKENIQLFEDEDRAIYNTRTVFQFDAEASAPLTEEDYLTVVNIPVLSFAQITQSIPGLSSSIGSFNTALPKMWPDPNPVFVNVTVGDYLFHGIPMYCNQPIDFQNIDVLLMCLSYSKVHPPSVLIDDPVKGMNSFSLLKYKNNTYDGTYEVRLGIDDALEIGQILSWDNRSHLTNWGGESCNKIQGTDATIFRPRLDNGDADYIYIYNTDICRTIKLTYDDDTEYQDIAGKRYIITKNIFAGVLENEDNYCYCPRSVKDLTQYGGCLKNGVLELSSCQGAPVVLSHPHFLYADESYQNGVIGLNPDPEKHLIHLDLETHTGTPLRGASRVQMNAFLKRIEKVDLMKNFPNVLVPAIWIDEGVELTPDLIDMLNDELFDILRILNITRWCLIAAGVAIVISTIAFFIYIKQKRQQRKMNPKSFTLENRSNHEE